MQGYASIECRATALSGQPPMASAAARFALRARDAGAAAPGSHGDAAAGRGRTPGNSTAGSNGLLRILRAECRTEYERLLRRLEPVKLEVGDVLFESGSRITCVYFLEGSVASLDRVLPGGQRVEVRTAGLEGMVGLPAFLDTGTAPVRCAVRIAGPARRLDAHAFREASQPGSTLHRILQRYVQYLLCEATQAGVCSRAHAPDGRCARWLLAMHDRVAGDRVQAPDELLASVVDGTDGKGRDAVESLRRAGMVRRESDAVVIVDRPALEAAACDCYGSDRSDYARLLRPAAATDALPYDAPGTWLRRRPGRIRWTLGASARRTAVRVRTAWPAAPSVDAGDVPAAALARALADRDAAHAARDAAELARTRAEVARNAAELATHVMRDDVDCLQERVAFLVEQVRSNAAYLAEVLEPGLVELRDERDALLQELALLNQERQDWVRLEAAGLEVPDGMLRLAAELGD